MFSLQVYVAPGYMQPAHPVNRRAPLPGSMVGHMSAGSPDRLPHEYDYPTPPSSSADSYYDDDDFIPAAVPKKVGYGSVAATYNPQAEKIITSSYTHPVRPRERSRSPDMSQRGTVIPVTHLDRHGRISPQQSISEKYGSEKYPVGVRSQLLYTAPAGVATGFVQSRPTNVDNTSPPPPPPPPPANFPPSRSYDTSPTSPTSYSDSPSPTRSKPQEIYAYPSKVTGPPQGHNEPSKQVKTSPSKDGNKQAPTSPKEKEAEIDALTNLLVQNMEAAGDPDFYGESTVWWHGNALLAPKWGHHSLGDFLHKGSVVQKFDGFFFVSLYKLLNKEWWVKSYVLKLVWCNWRLVFMMKFDPLYFQTNMHCSVPCIYFLVFVSGTFS